MIESTEEVSYEDIRAEKELLAQLLDCPGWKWAEERILEERAKGLETQILENMPTDIESMVMVNRVKGRVMELRTIGEIIRSQYTHACNEVERLQNQMEEEEENYAG